MRRVPLRTLLIVLVIVTTLPVAAFAAWVIARSSAQQEAVIDAQNIEQARAILVAVDREFEATIASLNVLAVLDPIDAPDKTQFSQIASRVLPLHPGWQSIRLIDPSMQVLSSTSGPAADAPLLSPHWVTDVLASGRPSISSVTRDPATGQWLVSIGVPVHRGGRLKYVLGARLYARMFSDLLHRQKTPAEGVVALLDAKHVITARTRNEDRYIGQAAQPEFLARQAKSPEGSWRTTMREGTPAYTAWSRSAATGWTVGIALPAAPIDGPVRRSLLALSAGWVAMMMTGLALAMVLGRGLIRAQKAASSAAAAIARGEPMPPFDSPIAEAHDLADGLREAAAILNTRLQERDKAQAEADRHKAALLERETSARRAAETLSRAKDEFIATVSHELRTPLNAIYGWLAMLRSGRLDAERQAHAFEVIDRNTRAQTQLIDDLLDMSRAIQGNIRLVMEPIDVALVLDSVIESLRPTAEARRLTIQAATPRGVAIVSGDQRRLQQVLWNILSNALKFTPTGGRIEAQIQAAGGDAVIRIGDSGEGIAPEFLPHVFDRFRQENASVTRTHSGLGLGLALVRHLVELHGGTIAAESEGKGKGSTFTIRLPLLAAEAEPDRSAAAQERQAADNADRLRGRRVLVVDDDKDARDLAAEVLGQAGAHVVKAASAEEAMAAIDQAIPDAIVADISMPLVSGYQLAERLRGDPRTASVALVALTAYTSIEARDAALAAGFEACLRKPYDPSGLVTLVASLVSDSQP
jgi:signal transduction histidine kinase/CheY-like chemotaxis protein